MSALRAFFSKPLRSIKTRITLSAVAAVMVGIATTTLLLVRQAEHDTVSAQRERELHASVAAAATLSRRAVGLQRALAATATILDEATVADERQLATFMHLHPVLLGLFSSVFVADAEGRVLLMADEAGPRKVLVGIADRAYFRQTIAEQRAIVSEPVASRVSSEPMVVFTQPLKNKSGIYGVLGGTLKFASRDMLDDLVGADDSDTHSLMVVTDSKGRILAHPDRARIMQPLSSEPQMAEGFARWLEAGAAAEPSGLLLDQPGQVLASAGVPGPDWVVWRALPETELLAPLHAARHQALKWAVAIVAVASLGVFGLITWLLRPLSLLRQRAMYLFDAGQDIDAGWPVADGEIGELTRVLRHVSAERAQLELFNAQVIAKLGSVMAAAPTGIMFTRAQKFELVSAEFCRLLQRSEADCLGQHAGTIFASNEDYVRLGPLVTSAFDAGEAYSGQWRIIRPDGSVFWGRLRAQPVEHGNTDAGTIWTLNDVTAQVVAREELEWSAGHDALTGLPNRSVFDQRVKKTFESLPKSLPAAVVMIDLDRFKPINDTAGHAAGDAMLKAVASAMTSHVRSGDVVARIGGDEFALLLDRCPADAAQRTANAVRQAISNVVLVWQGRPLSVGASVGVSHLSADTESIASWMQEADAACYAAKAAGREADRPGTRPVLKVVNEAQA